MIVERISDDVEAFRVVVVVAIAFVGVDVARVVNWNGSFLPFLLVVGAVIDVMWW